MATSPGAGFPWEDEGVAKDAELSTLDLPGPPEDLLEFPSESDGRAPAAPPERLPFNKSQELALLSFPSAGNVESSPTMPWRIPIHDIAVATRDRIHAFCLFTDGRFANASLLRFVGTKEALSVVICLVALGVSAIVVPLPQIPTTTTLTMRIGASVSALTFYAAERTLLTPHQSPVVGDAVARAMGRPDTTRKAHTVGTKGTRTNVPLPARSVSQQPRPAVEYRGSLEVNSSPEGASVFVNGVLVGGTPILLPDLPIGSRVVRIDLDGHERWSTAVRIVANEVTRVTATLRPTSRQ